MPKRLRFTGQNPPPELWREYPNWRNAYEEEGRRGQDESTLMPDEVQTYVSADASFKAGIARLHEGRQFPAILAVSDRGMDGCEVYESARPWRVYYSYPDKRWVSFEAEWLPEEKRPPIVSLSDDRVFPLEIHMILPWKPGGRPTSYLITKEGRMHEIGT